MKHLLQSICTLGLLSNIHGAIAQEARNYYVGHSLVNLDIPYQVKEIARQRTVDVFYRHHINIGTPLKQNWLDTAFNVNAIFDPELMMDVEHGTNHLKELLNPYNHLVLTEAVPLLNYNRDTTITYASRFVTLAQTANSSIKTYIYATWEGDVTEGSTWRANLASLAPEWEDIASKVAMETGSETYIIPGNRVMMAIYDTLQTAPIGSFTNITDFFQPDGIHLNFNGNYIIAVLTASILHQIDPVGTDSIEGGPYTDDFVITDNEARKKIQQIVRQVACEYRSYTNYTAWDCELGLDDAVQTTAATFSIAPNPSTSIINIQGSSPIAEVNLFSLHGVALLSARAYINTHELQLDISSLPAGMYVVKITTAKGYDTARRVIRQ